MGQDAVFILGLTVITIVGLSAVYFFFSYLGDVMARRMKDLGGRATKLGQGEFNCNGQTVTVDYGYPTSDSQPELRLSVGAHITIWIIVRKKTLVDRIAKGIGATKKIRLGDPALDDKFHLECEDEDFVRQWLRQAEVKAALSSLLTSYDYLEITA